MVNLLPSRKYIPAELCQPPEVSVKRMAKTILRQSTVCWLVARMAFGAGESVNVLVVEVAILARHLLACPDRFCEIGKLLGKVVFALFLVLILLHNSSPFRKKMHHIGYILAEVAKISSFFNYLQLN